MAKIFNIHEKVAAAAPEDYTAPAFSEEALAVSFAERYGNMRYVAAWNKWLIFDGRQWQFDETRKTFSLARIHCRMAAVVANKPSEAKATASAKTRAAVVVLAGEDRRLAATVDQWDIDPWLLNTPSGVVNLRTGEIREHRADDFMTKITAVAPDPNCTTPLWQKFLDRVTNKDKNLQAYHARVTGYGLTGITIEHALFFWYGSGRNGKGTMMTTVANILGDYHRNAPIETFTATRNEQHPTELAMLRGARLVTATETEEGRSWAESRIKMLTGGDIISARFMRQDFFEYLPQFKLIISGNHKPGLRSVDEAIRARLNLVPFTVFIPPEERDLNLAEKLKTEWPGILAWMVKGCLEWQHIGLAPPATVAAATAEYLDAEDTVQLWIDDCCEIGKKHWTQVSDLFASWKFWAEANGEYVLPSKRFAERLDAFGYQPEKRNNGQRGRIGLALKPLVVPKDIK